MGRSTYCLHIKYIRLDFKGPQTTEQGSLLLLDLWDWNFGEIFPKWEKLVEFALEEQKNPKFTIEKYKICHKIKLKKHCYWVLANR
jgi:hypothetical protein